MGLVSKFRVLFKLGFRVLGFSLGSQATSSLSDNWGLEELISIATLFTTVVTKSRDPLSRPLTLCLKLPTEKAMP